MKTLLTLSGAGLMLASGAAFAQDADAPVPEAAEPMVEAQAFTDAQIEGFAEAAMGIRELQADTSVETSAKQEQAVAIVAEAGLDAETFNAIGEAMQTDPETAQRVQLAIANMQGQPEG